MDISEELRRFISLHIDSMEKLEVLLFLRKNKDSEWTAKKVSSMIRTNESSVQKRLSDLCDIGILTSRTYDDEIHYTFGPARKELLQIIDELDDFNSKRRVSLIDLIFSKPSSCVQSFADAFKFRKD